MIRKRDSRSFYQARKHETKHSKKDVILAVHKIVPIIVAKISNTIYVSATTIWIVNFIKAVVNSISNYKTKHIPLFTFSVNSGRYSHYR